MVRLSELKSNVQNSRPFKIATALPDDIITQREDPAGAVEDEEQETAEGEQERVATEARPRRRKPARVAEAVTRVEPEEKPRGRRQKDFDLSEQNESSDEENQSKERSRATEDVWSQSQQKLLELALQQYPKGTSDRWDKIAKCVPSKSKVGNEGLHCSGVGLPTEVAVPVLASPACIPRCYVTLSTGPRISVVISLSSSCESAHCQAEMKSGC